MTVYLEKSPQSDPILSAFQNLFPNFEKFHASRPYITDTTGMKIISYHKKGIRKTVSEKRSVTVLPRLISTPKIFIIKNQNNDSD